MPCADINEMLISGNSIVLFLGIYNVNRRNEFQRFRREVLTPKEDGKTFITCSAIDNGKPFMSVKLLVGDEEQALYIKNRFLNDNAIYSEIIELLTKE